MKTITKIEAADTHTEKKLRVAAYARVSTSSDEQLISLDAQKNHYEVLIWSHKDWEFAGLYFDEGISGTKIPNGAGHLKWHESNIHQILTNEKYIGDALLQKTYTVSILDKKRAANNGEMPTMLTEYSDAITRRLVEKITIFDEKIVVELKSGLQMEVEA